MGGGGGGGGGNEVVPTSNECVRDSRTRVREKVCPGVFLHLLPLSRLPSSPPRRLSPDPAIVPAVP